MLFTDIALIGCLVLLVLAALRWRVFWLRFGVSTLLVGVVMLALVTQEPLARSVISRRHAEGKWTQDFRDGVFQMLDATRPYRVYIFVSTVGLAVLAVRRNVPKGRPG